MSVASIRWDNLEQDPWIPEIGSSINSVLADNVQAYYPVTIPGMSLQGLAFVNSSTKANGGGLVYHNSDFPDIASAYPYTMFTYMYYIPEFCFPYISRLETDLTIVPTAAPVGGTTQNKVNMAMQYNWTSKTWQLTDKNGNWIDSGTLANPPLPDQLAQVIQKGKIDYTNKTFSVLSINEEAVTNPNLINIPWFTSNWTKTINKQLQTEVAMPGAPTVLFTGIAVVFSNQPF